MMSMDAAMGVLMVLIFLFSGYLLWIAFDRLLRNHDERNRRNW